MPFLELTRILSDSKTVKWSINPNNLVYIQARVEGVSIGGCTLVDLTGKDVDVVETYQDVMAKLKNI
jgi:hypothetical protein